MATFFSGQIVGAWASNDNYMYGTLTGNVSRSGNKVTLSEMSLAITSRYTSTGSAPWSFTVNGTTTSTTLSHPPTTMGLNNTSFDVSVNQTSATVSWSAPEGYSGSFSVSFPSAVEAPNTPSVVGQNTDAFSNTISYATSSFGNPSSGTIYLYASTDNTNWTQIASKTTTGSSSFLHSGLLPNFTYYYRSKATNAYAESAYSQTITVKTKPAVYVSVDGASKAAQKGYASLNGVSKEILKIYDSDNGVSRRIY